MAEAVAHGGSRGFAVCGCLQQATGQLLLSRVLNVGSGATTWSLVSLALVESSSLEE